MRDFSAATRAKLAAKGVSVYGIVAIPSNGDLPFANATRGYKIDDNGCGRIWTFAQVMECAA